MIEGGRQNGGNSSIKEFGEDTNKFSGYKQQQWIYYQHDREVKKDREERTIIVKFSKGKLKVKREFNSALTNNEIPLKVNEKAMLHFNINFND